MTDDDELLAGLRRAAAAADPVPDLVTRAAEAALSTRRLDEELAELVHDSELVAPGQVRADDDVRLLSFETTGVSVELQVEYAAGRVSLRGLVSGASGEALVEVAGERRAVPIDDEGWFVATGLPRGATRVRVTADDGRDITTGWALL